MKNCFISLRNLVMVEEYINNAFMINLLNKFKQYDHGRMYIRLVIGRYWDYELLSLETSDSLEGYKGDGHRQIAA